MTCEEAENLISARIDGELPMGDPAAVALDAHLAGCAACRATADATQVQDATLVRAFAPGRRSAEAVAERVARVLPSRRRYWLTALAASGLAAGIVLAAVTLGPRLREDRPEEIVASNPITQPSIAELATRSAAAPIAQVALSTGEVFTCPSHKTDEWQPVMPGAALAEGDRVRTNPSARVELVLADGSQVRLNGETEARLDADRCVELKQGQLWSAVPPQCPPLRVTAPPAANAEGSVTVITPPGGRVDFRCAPAGSVLTAIHGPATVTDKLGSETRVPSGAAVTLVNGLASGQSAGDVLLTTRWLNELLMLKGPDDPELTARVKDLLSRINEESTATRPAAAPGPVEQSMRAQGDRWSEPLACHIRSPQSLVDRTTRLTAARLLADLAPPSAIGDLIGLLGDADGQVRFHAATALHRLTGQTLDRSPAQCASDPAEATKQTQAKWLAWWEQHKPNAAQGS